MNFLTLNEFLFNIYISDKYIYFKKELNRNLKNKTLLIFSFLLKSTKNMVNLLQDNLMLFQ